MYKENQEIQILRGIAILAVVGIHTLSIGITNTQSNTLGHYMYQIIHTLLQFAVPTFIFISSMMITYSLQENKLYPSSFYKKKFFKIGIPYILWTLIYVLPQIAKGWIPVDRLWNPKSWLYWMLYGKGYDHLYYLSVTLQLYLIAPLSVAILQFLTRFFKQKTIYILLPIALLGQVCIYLINQRYISHYFSAQATLVIWYFVIIVIGMWAGFNYEIFVNWLKKNTYFLVISLGMISLIYINYKLKMVYQIAINTTYYQFIWYAYVFIMTLNLFYLALKITSTKIGHLFLVLGNYSFGIYLIHPMMTYWLRKVLTTDHALLLGILLGISMSCMIGLCIIASKLLLKHKYTKILLGTYH